MPVNAPRIAIQLRNSTPWAAGQLDKLRDRVARKRIRIARQRVETVEFELLVDEARARAVEPMRQAAGADHQRFDVLVIGIERAANRTP